MGEAKLRLERANRVVKFDLNAPKYIRMRLSEGATEPAKNNEITAVVINSIVRAKFGQQMPRTDGQKYAAWQEVIIDEDVTAPEMILEQVNWLSGLLESNEVKVDPSLSHAREALADYVRGVKLEAESRPDVAEAPAPESKQA